MPSDAGLWPKRSSLTLLGLYLVLAASGAAAQIASRDYFPYGRNYRSTENNPYQLYFTSIRNISPGQQVCFKVAVNTNQCAGLTGNQLLCCNALLKDVHVFQLEADPICVDAVQRVTKDGEPSSWQFNDDPNHETGVLKIQAGNGMDATNVEDHTFCFTLREPCANLTRLSVTGGTLVWAVETDANVQGLPNRYNARCSTVGTKVLDYAPPSPPTPPPSPGSSPVVPVVSPNPLPSPPGSSPPHPGPPSPAPPSPPHPRPSPPGPRPSPPMPKPSPPRPPVPPSPRPGSPSPNITSSPPPASPPAPLSPPPVVQPPEGIAFPLPASNADYDQTAYQLQVYDVQLSDTALTVVLQATVQDLERCKAAGSSRACDVLSGLALQVDPAQYGNFSDLLDVSKATCSVQTDDGTFDASSGLNVSANAASNPPVIACLLPKAVGSNSAARVTYVIPRNMTPADPSPSAVNVVAWGESTWTTATLSTDKLVNNANILGNPNAASSGVLESLNSSGLAFVINRDVADGNTRFTLSGAGPSSSNALLDANQPLYVRLPVDPTAGSPTEVHPTVLASTSSSDITFTAAPSTGNGLSYSWVLPGDVTYSQLCPQSDNQPPNSCVLQVIGSDGSVWEGIITNGTLPTPTSVPGTSPPPGNSTSPPPPIIPSPSPWPPITPPPTRDLSALFPGLPTDRCWGYQTNWQAQSYTRSPGDTTYDITYQLAAADTTHCSGNIRCDSLVGFAALLDPQAFGTGWNLSATKATTDSGATLKLAYGSVNGTDAVGVLIQPPLNGNQAIRVKFTLSKPAGSGTPANSSATSQDVLLWGTRSLATQPLDLTRQVFNPDILLNGNYNGSATQPGEASGLSLTMEPLNLNGSQMGLVVADSSVPREVATGRHSNLQPPLYLRLHLTPGAANGLSPGKAVDGSLAQPAAAFSSTGGGDVTWTVLPTASNSMNYSYALPGAQALRDNTSVAQVCQQGVVADQPNNTCLVQVITSNGTVYNWYLNATDLGLPAPVELQNGLPSQVVNAGARQVGSMADTNWDVQLYRATENASAITLDYLVSVGDVATCSSAGLTACAYYNSLVMAIDTTQLGTDVLGGNATVTNPDWQLPGTPTPTISVKQVERVLYVTAVEGSGRSIGSGGPTTQLYSVTLPKAPGAPGQLLQAYKAAPQDTETLLIPPPSAVLVEGTSYYASSQVQPPVTPRQTYDPTIQQDPSYAGTAQPVPGNCIDVKASTASDGAGNTLLTLTSNAWVNDPACKALLNGGPGGLQRPMYMRVKLSDAATAALANAGASISPSAGAVLARAPENDATDLGSAVTWSNLPYYGNSFTYTVKVPGTLSMQDVCAQNQALPFGGTQAPGTCVVQLISGANSTVWTAPIANAFPTNQPPFPPMPPGPAPPSPSSSSGLSYNEKVAIIVCSVVGGILLICLCCLILLFCHRRRQRKWAPAKSAVAGYGGNRAMSSGHPASLPLSSTTSMPPPASQAGGRPSGAADGSSPSPDDHNSQVSALSNLRPDSLAGSASVMGGGAPSVMGAPSLLGGASSAAASTYLPVPPSANITQHPNEGEIDLPQRRVRADDRV